VSERDSFLLRMDGKLLAALRKWSEDEMRSTNSQIEYLLRRALLDAGRLPKPAKPPGKQGTNDSDALQG
jgi:hypothetical protein